MEDNEAGTGRRELSVEGEGGGHAGFVGVRPTQ